MRPDAHCAKLGSIAMMIAGAYRSALTLVACAPITRPMNSRIGTSACIGNIPRNKPTRPLKQTSATTMPVTSE